MASRGRWSLQIAFAFLSLLLTQYAQARCINTTTGGQATDGVDQPTSGQSVVCDTAAPNPSTTTITSPAGSTGATVVVMPGAIVSTTPRAIGLNGNASSVLNQGTVRTSGLNAFGIDTTGVGNTLTNAGAINTTGSRGHGLSATGSNSTLVNSGTITVSGAGASGIRSTETTATTSITNSGSITASGAPSAAPAPTLFANGVSLVAGTFQNLAGGTVTSTQAFGVLGGDGGITVRNAGTISGGNGTAIQLGNGANVIAMTGGLINGAITTGTGADQFTWSGGNIVGNIRLGAGGDTATLRNITDAQLATVPIVDGGAATDRLVLDNSTVTGFGRFTNWENIDLINNTRLTLDATGMTLGDAGTGTGVLTIGASSTLFAGNGANATIQSFNPTQPVTVANAGAIDLTNGGSIAANSLTIAGNYSGLGGLLHLNTVLEADASPSDKLVISGGTATGSTNVVITNVGGAGALTTGNGILVVNTINGGTTAPGSFSLAGPAVAGPYEYTLHRGSVDATDPQAWFLRSTIDCSVPGASAPPCPVPPSTPPPPNFRVETSLYAALPSLALLYGRNLLDTLHERVGEKEDQRSATGLNELGYHGEGWGRFIGLHGNHDGDSIGVFGSGPDFRYDFLGVQAGRDFYRRESPDGSRDQVGLYFAYGTASARVTHFDGNSGDDRFTGYTFGGYWTHFGAPGWYIDAVAQGTYYDVHSTANRGLPELTTHGPGFAGSLEGGYPFHFAGGYFIEPQAQLVYQHINLSDASDIGASVRFDDVDSLAGRIGARFGRTWALESGPNPRLITAWLRPNFWYEFLGDPKTQFSSADGFIPFRADIGGPWLELNAGVSGQIDKRADLFANISFQTKFNDTYAVAGKVGVRMLW